MRGDKADATSGGDPVAPRGAIPRRPATTPSEYLHNCDEGLETFSERRFAKLMGWSRVQLYRAKLMGEIPEDLFEQLRAAGVLSSKALANVALAFRRGRSESEVERCPHCGGALRSRHRVGEAAREAIRAWLCECERATR